VLNALMPEADVDGLIIVLRSATAVVGSYVAHLDHLAEMSGKAAEVALAIARR
jgi:elongation factor G